MKAVLSGTTVNPAQSASCWFCNPRVRNTDVHPLPHSCIQPSIAWVLSSAVVFLMAMISGGLMETPLHSHCIVVVLFSSYLQSLGFDLTTHSSEQDHVCMGVLQRKHRCTRKSFHGSKLTLFPLRDRLKAGDFLPPWTSIELEPEPMWCSVCTSGQEWDSTALLWALGFLAKSSCCCGIQIPIYLTTY